MRAQIFALSVFGVVMWWLIFMRLQGGFVEIKENAAKSMRGTDTSLHGECALLFFGLAKNFNELVFPSVKRFILTTNPRCDIYAHTYDIKEITNPRNNELHTKINPMEVYSMTSNVVVDTLNSVVKHIDFDYYHRTYTQTNGVFPYSMDNTLKQWYSIQRVWDSMSKKYERVGLFRLDVVYTESVDLRNGEAVIPDFHHSGGLNDRAFYGLYKWAEKWATDRFKKLSVRATEKKIYDMHAETFVKYLMRDVPVELKPLCFKRVRATGKILNDCSPRTPSLDYHFIHIPKTGGTFIERWGSKNGKKWGFIAYKNDKHIFDVQSRHPNICKDVSVHSNTCCSPWHYPPEKPFDVKTFCTIRHPYTRAISQVKYISKNRIPNDVNRAIMMYVAEFKKNSMFQDCHWVPQSKYVPYCSRVLRFEHLEDDFKQLLFENGIGYRKSATTYSNKLDDARQLLTNQTKHILNTVYAEDLALWESYAMRVRK